MVAAHDGLCYCDSCLYFGDYLIQVRSYNVLSSSSAETSTKDKYLNEVLEDDLPQKELQLFQYEI